MNFTSVPVIILFIITLTATAVRETFNASYIKRKNVNVCDIYLIQIGIGVSCALALFVLSGFYIKLSVFSALLGLIFGAVTAGQSITNSFAIKKGPYGFTNVIVNGSTAITAISGWLFFSESLTMFNILGIIFMLACIMLATDQSKDNKKASLLWILLCFITMVFSASIGLMQKIHQNSYYKDELLGFLIIAFIVQTIVSTIMYLFIRNSEIKSGSYLQSEMKINGAPYMIILMAVCGICFAIANCFNLYLSGVVDAAVFFPIINGVPLMISLIVSFVFFKERLIKKQIIGFICGLISIIFFLI